MKPIRPYHQITSFFLSWFLYCFCADDCEIWVKIVSFDLRSCPRLLSATGSLRYVAVFTELLPWYISREMGRICDFIQILMVFIVDYQPILLPYVLKIHNRKLTCIYVAVQGLETFILFHTIKLCSWSNTGGMLYNLVRWAIFHQCKLIIPEF